MPEDVAIHVLFSKGCAAKPFSMDRDPNFIMLNPGSGLENFVKLAFNYFWTDKTNETY